MQLLRLREWREERGLTQTELAEKVGVTQGVIASYEAGRYSPKLEILVRMANVLNISAGELIAQPAEGQQTLC